MSVTAPQMESVLQQLQATATQAGQMVPQPTTVQQTGSKPDFAAALVASINKIDEMQDAAGAQAKAFERGEPGISISNVMIDLQKSSLAFNMGLQVRNRLVMAYKSVMNMQV